MDRLIIGITGATGTIYGMRLMEMLRAHGDIEIHLVMSNAAKLTLKMEHDVEPDQFLSLAHVVHEVGNIGASISSGSIRSKGMPRSSSIRRPSSSVFAEVTMLTWRPRSRSISL